MDINKFPLRPQIEFNSNKKPYMLNNSINICTTINKYCESCFSKQCICDLEYELMHTTDPDSKSELLKDIISKLNINSEKNNDYYDSDEDYYIEDYYIEDYDDYDYDSNFSYTLPKEVDIIDDISPPDEEDD